MRLDSIASDFGISVVATVLPGAVSGRGERIEFLNFLPPLEHRLRSPYLSFHIMTISSIHPSQGRRPHRISRSRMQQLLASGGLQLVGRCRKYSSCSHSLDLACHAMPCHAMVCSRSPLLTLIDPACSHHTSLVATSRTSRRKHYSTWRHRALFLGKKTGLLSELKVYMYFTALRRYWSSSYPLGRASPFGL